MFCCCFFGFGIALGGALLALVFCAGILRGSLKAHVSCLMALLLFDSFLGWSGARWCSVSVVALCRQRGFWPGRAWQPCLPGQRVSAAQGVAPSRPVFSVQGRAIQRALGGKDPCLGKVDVLLEGR